MMNLTRRQFLQGMLAVASATMLPPIAFDNPLLDEPVTDDVPMAYVQVGTQRLKSKGMSLEISYDIPDLDGRSMRECKMYCTLTFEVPPNQELYSMFVHGEICPIVIDILGSGMTFSGDFALTNLEMIVTPAEELFVVTAERVSDSSEPIEIRIETT